MKNSRMIIIAVVLIAAAAAFLLFYKPEPSDKDIMNDPAAAMKFCQESPEVKQNDCYMKVAEVLGPNNKDAAFLACSELTDSPTENTVKRDCIEKLIQAQNNTDAKLDICKKIVEEGWKKDCLESLVNEEQNPEKAVEICNVLADDKNFREHCYGAIYAHSENLSSDTELAMCEKKTGKDQSNCYWGIAKDLWMTNAPKALEICNRITDSVEKDNCLNEFISTPELVKASPDLAVSICDSFTLKSRCYTDVARVISGTDPKKAAEICKKLSDDVQKSDCYGNVWFSFNSMVVSNYDFTVSLCNALTIKRDDCLQRIVGVFIDLDRAKAEATCRLMSEVSSPGCLQSVSR